MHRPFEVLMFAVMVPSGLCSADYHARLAMKAIRVLPLGRVRVLGGACAARPTVTVASQTLLLTKTQTCFKIPLPTSGYPLKKGVWHQPVEDEGEAGANEGKLLYRALRAANSSFKVANSGRTSSAPELAQPSCKAIIPADMNKKSLSITPSLYRTGKR
ncbi:MAG: hypothetical protein VCE91_16010 [Nitrospinota bacterium]